jgi:mannose PTS system EIIA component
MVGLVIICHGGLGECLIASLSHMMGARPPQVKSLGFTIQTDFDLLTQLANEAIAECDSGKGVLILTDMFGATPSNLAARLSKPGKIDAVAGVNLPMLVRAVTYRKESLAVLVEKAIAGGTNGIVRVPPAPQTQPDSK